LREEEAALKRASRVTASGQGSRAAKKYLTDSRLNGDLFINLKRSEGESTTKRRWSLRIAGIVTAMDVPLFITSCYKDYDLDTVDYDVVVTDYDSTADFPSKDTYSMPDEIRDVGDLEGAPLDIPVSGKKDIFAKIEANMTALGYTKVMDPLNDARDVSILVGGAE
jgi:hypothetical protein